MNTPINFSVISDKVFRLWLLKFTLLLLLLLLFLWFCFYIVNSALFFPSVSTSFYYYQLYLRLYLLVWTQLIGHASVSVLSLSLSLSLCLSLSLSLLTFPQHAERGTVPHVADPVFAITPEVPLLPCRVASDEYVLPNLFNPPVPRGQQNRTAYC